MKEEISISETFDHMIAFLVRQRKRLFAFLIIGVAIVMVYQNFLKKQYYETYAICTSGISEYERSDELQEFSQRTAVDMINLLSSYVSNKDYTALSNMLSIDESIPRAIKKIEAEQLYQQDMNEKFVALNKFKITLLVYDNSKIPDIANGLMNYFNNNKYIESYFSTYQDLSKDLIDKIDLEINDLSTIRSKNVSNSFDIRSENVLEGPNKSLSNEIITLYHIQQKEITKQKHLKPLAFVQEFVLVNKWKNDIILWSVLGAIISLILGIIIVGATERYLGIEVEKLENKHKEGK